MSTRRIKSTEQLVKDTLNPKLPAIERIAAIVQRMERMRLEWSYTAVSSDAVTEKLLPVILGGIKVRMEIVELSLVKFGELADSIFKDNDVDSESTDKTPLPPNYILTELSEEKLIELSNLLAANRF